LIETRYLEDGIGFSVGMPPSPKVGLKSRVLQVRTHDGFNGKMSTAGASIAPIEGKTSREKWNAYACDQL